MKTKTLVIIAVVLVVALVLMRRTIPVNQLPWNVGQAGSVFQAGQYGGGQ